VVTTGRQGRIIAETRRWLEEVVVGLNLCPFARRPLAAGQVRFVVSSARDDRALLEALFGELQCLDSHDAASIETTLLLIPDHLGVFSDFNAFLDLAEGLLESQGYRGVYQLATFHPGYQFAGTEPGDAENLTNRAPYPILHLLREASIEGALANNPDPGSIPDNNIRTVSDLSPARRRALFPYLFPGPRG
jgi:hypothetical protein